MLNLFALTDDPASRVVRFSLSQEVQSELTPFLQNQEMQFTNSIDQEIAFDGKYKPDSGQALVIANFDDIDGLSIVIRNPLSVAEVVASPEVFQIIKALFTGYIDQSGGVTILIQHFDKRKIISTNGLSIFHSANVYKKIEGIGLTIDSKLTAILKDGSLKFFSFHLLRQIFDMSEYYKEATDSDIDDFASLQLITADSLPNLISISDTWVRRKFSLIQQSQILENVPLNDIKAVAAEFNIPLATTTADGIEKIVLPGNKADLKTLLRFLDEDYYKSPLSKTQYITNSKRVA
ncbi:Kiwa anti-phage protein KwaB-like domain-containing protein [Methylomonas sp. 11b]|uniref:Kiwa anti-phage protein KwaB-like domain-containing protein n=1 Tax=Methylomonas sp. 11b TaxID=1168169 RepID=UPI00047D9E1F|nr:Kiwa anti-phage protein KwaB-like domain-containing protein [Methylomonas sp. 11b]